jgi:acetolactate synthase regulatory subunit
MQTFQIRYRNTQGTLMRILNAAVRRGIELQSVQAGIADQDHRVTLLLQVTQKQARQLYREWYSVADVTDVGYGAVQHGHGDDGNVWSSVHPPAPEALTELSAYTSLTPR